MAAKRTKRWPNGQTIRDSGSQPITRAEFETLRKSLDEREEALNELRREIQDACRLGEDVRREQQTQFTRIAQLQQEVDALKRRT